MSLTPRIAIDAMGGDVGVRVMLAGCLAGVVAQLLCKRVPKGRCAVHEILLTHEALPNTIRSGQIANIRAIIESGGADGMVTMDTSLMNRVKDGTIEAKEAYMKAANKAAFFSSMAVVIAVRSVTRRDEAFAVVSEKFVQLANRCISSS